MEYLWMFLVIISFISILYGLTLSVGLGWAIFILDLFSHSVSADYANAQRSIPVSKDGNTKNKGIFIVILGLIFGYLASLI